MQRIAIDCRFAGTSSGLGRYARELVSALLQRRDAVEYVLLVLPEAKNWIATLPDSKNWCAVEIYSRHYSLSEHWVIPRLLRKHTVDLLFSPHFTAPPFCPVPFVVTVHDLILHAFPNAAPLWKRMGYRVLMRHAVRDAKAIITISNFVAQEIARAYGPQAAERTQVITEGVGNTFSRKTPEEQKHVRERYSIDGPFFLYVGNAKEHKNVPMLLAAFSALPSSSPQLVLVTGGKEADSLRLPPRVLRLSDLQDDDLAALYSAAACFVTPSLYEGFCLPLAEALACGCPAIALIGGPMAEVSQGQARLIEPTVEALTHALRSPPPHPVAFIPPRWEDAARQTAEVLLNQDA